MNSKATLHQRLDSCGISRILPNLLLTSQEVVKQGSDVVSGHTLNDLLDDLFSSSGQRPSSSGQGQQHRGLRVVGVQMSEGITG